MIPILVLLAWVFFASDPSDLGTAGAAWSIAIWIACIWQAFASYYTGRVLRAQAVLIQALSKKVGQLRRGEKEKG